MNVIKLAIGSGILLLSCGAYSQSISEKTNSDKKGAAELSAQRFCREDDQ